MGRWPAWCSNTRRESARRPRRSERVGTSRELRQEIVTSVASVLQARGEPPGRHAAKQRGGTGRSEDRKVLWPSHAIVLGEMCRSLGRELGGARRIPKFFRSFRPSCSPLSSVLVAALRPGGSPSPLRGS